MRRTTVRDQRSGGRRSAYTLVEMLLVLAVIATLAAISWPSVLRLQADHDLNSAAEDVRQHLASARTRAIKSGVKYQFRYEPNGRHFAVVPLEAEPETLAVPPGPNGATPNAGAPQHRIAGELPKSVSFAAPASQTATLPNVQKLSESAFQGLDNAGDLAGIGWSDPLIFAADGSAMDAVVSVEDRRGWRIEIAVRGLTGAAATGPMHREATP